MAIVLVGSMTYVEGLGTIFDTTGDGLFALIGSLVILVEYDAGTVVMEFCCTLETGVRVEV